MCFWYAFGGVFIVEDTETREPRSKPGIVSRGESEPAALVGVRAVR